MKDSQGNDLEVGDILHSSCAPLCKIMCVAIRVDVAEMAYVEGLNEDFRLDQRSLSNSRWVKE